MTLRWPHLGFWASLFLLALKPDTSPACSCASGLAFSLPREGDSAVPLNARLSLGFTFEAPAAFSLIDGTTGAELPIEINRQTTGNLTQVLVALADGGLLEPNRPYELKGDQTRILAFTTGEGVDETAPTLSGITSFSGHYDDGYHDGGYSTCGESVSLRIEYDGAGDDLADSDALLYRISVLNVESSEAGAAGTGAFEPKNLLLKRSWSLGWSLCLSTMEELRPGDRVTIQAATVDAAGNQSELSSQVSTVVGEDPDVEEEESSGCEVSGRGGPGTSSFSFIPAWLALLLAAAPFWRVLRLRP